MSKIISFLKANYLYITGAGLLGLLMGLWLPRGPLETTVALLLIIASLAIGIGSGLKSILKRNALLYITVFWVVYELSRLSMVGPTVDMPSVSSLYGIMALVSGRLFHLFLIVFPLSVGYLFAKRYTSYHQEKDATWRQLFKHYVTKPSIVISAILLIGFLSLLLRPASTPAMEGENSIAEFSTISVDGQDQTMLIRGQDIDNPVLLHLAGGPGGTDIAAMRMFGSELEKNFVVATWDQRGVGKSYTSLDPTDNLTLEQTIDDTIIVTDYLRERFNEEKIYLLGNSWGTTLGILVAQERPELFHAFIGAGQMVSQRETDIMFYEDTLAWARETKNTGLEQQLLDNGPPPYDDIHKYEVALSHEHDWGDYPYFTGESEMSATLIAGEYSLLDTIHSFGALLDTFSVLYPQLQDIDFRSQVTKLDVPFYMVQGVYEARGRAVLADEWFELIEAPYKERFDFERSAHRPLFEEPDKFAEVMQKVLAQTNEGGS